MQRHEQAGGGENDQAEDDRFGRGGADIAEHDLEIGDRRRQDFVDGADEFRKVDAERGVGDALRQHRQHDQARHDEGAVADALDLGDARADRGAEHHEIQRGRDHRRDDALQQRAPGARHFEQIDGADGPEVHGALTRSDEDVFQRDLRRVEIVEADAGVAEVAEQAGDAGALALGVVVVDQLAAAVATVRARNGARLSGSASILPCRCSVSRFLPSFCINVALSSTSTISPLLMTPMRSAISSASSM